MFGERRLVPLDRNAKVSIMALARAFLHRSEKGKHYGILTAKFIRVLEALVWGFHNAATERCFPSYEAIVERAHCAEKLRPASLSDACRIFTGDGIDIGLGT